jgi:hypothetical protein
MPAGIYKRTKEMKTGKYIRSLETRKKISNTLKIKIANGEIIPAWTGRKHTEEQKQKMSKALKGKRAWNRDTKVRKGEYKFITRNKIKKPESHWIWFDNYGYFPKKNQIMHHKDFNESNNKIENLQLMSRSEHISMHNKLNISPGTKRGEIKMEEIRGDTL